MLWDAKFSDKYEKFSTWTREIKSIFQNNNLEYFYENINNFQSHDTIETLKLKMKEKQTANLKLKCLNKPQLRTYVQIKNFDLKPCFLQKPLSFIQRKFLAKLCTSCLELKICTGRYLQLPEASRVCLVTAECRAQDLVESESHFVLRCEGYRDLRQQLYDKLTLPDQHSRLCETHGPVHNRCI